MSAVNKLLDKYREVCALSSDSALADSLKLSRQGVHQWRKGTSWPSEDHVISMANAINEPAERWFLAISADRASPAGRKVWMKLLQAAAAVVLTAGLTGLTSTAANAQSVGFFADNSANTVYYVKFMK